MKPDVHDARMLIRFADKILSQNVQHNHVIVAAEMLQNAVQELRGAGSGGAVVKRIDGQDGGDNDALVDPRVTEREIRKPVPKRADKTGRVRHRARTLKTRK